MQENEQNPFGDRYDWDSHSGSGSSGHETGSTQDALPQLPDGAATPPGNYPPLRASGTPSNYYQNPYRERSASPGRRGRAGGIVVFSILVVVIIVALAMAFSAPDSSRGAARPDLNGEFFGGYESPAPGGDYADDYRDYLYDYYTGSVSGVYNIPRATTGTGVTLSLRARALDAALSLQQVYKALIPSVCGISASSDPDIPGYSWGTGIIFSSDGYIITNAHVIDGASSVTVTLYDGEEHEARLVGADSINDIAVLKIDVSGLTAAEFGDLEGIAVGDEVVAIGNPLGEELSGTMTDGIISAINRDVSYQGHTLTLLQTNAALNEGNSGGPLINMYGQVIGITNMKMMSSYSTIEGIGFAIPATVAKPVVDALIRDGYVSGQPALGVTCGPIPSSAQSYYTLPGGLFVSSVVEGSDAYSKGIRSGDIITKADGAPVYANSDITQLIDTLGVGDIIELTIFRDGKTFAVEVELMDRSVLYAASAGNRPND